jgi:S-adenosylmethionine synthetase
MAKTGKSIFVEQVNGIPVNEQAIEYVERKGVGHPDSLIDGICEKASIELSKYYLDEIGSVLHHNVDKGLVVGGSSTVTFGKGIITRPIEIIIAGRATAEYEGKKIPVDEIAIRAARDYLNEHTRFLDIQNEVVINSKILSGSADLTQIFKRNSAAPLANDTSFGIGFAPFSETENLVLETEHFLNGKEYKARLPSVGEDIKVMGVKEADRITLTIAIAFVAKYISDMDEYVRIKETVSNDVKNFAKKFTKKEVEVLVDTGDSHERMEIYLTKSGLSCEAGDDGEVGRGNRINGLITPFRHMSLEAAAGKNPINHVGKIYNVLAEEIAHDVVKLYPQIKECNISVVSQIGRSIADPKNLSIKVIMENGEKIDPIQSKVYAIADEMLDNIRFLTNEIIAGKYGMF